MKELIEKVREFHKVFLIEDKQNYEKNPDCADMRYKLMKEENEEYLAACAVGDEVEIADALGDQLYILLGTILSHNMEHKIEEVFNEIHRSNMSKLEDGKPLMRPDGKVLKGKDYFKPNIKKILDNGKN